MSMINHLIDAPYMTREDLELLFNSEKAPRIFTIPKELSERDDGLDSLVKEIVKEVCNKRFIKIKEQGSNKLLHLTLEERFDLLEEAILYQLYDHVGKYRRAMESSLLNRFMIMPLNEKSFNSYHLTKKIEIIKITGLDKYLMDRNVKTLFDYYWGVDKMIKDLPPKSE